MTMELAQMCTTDDQRRQCHNILNVLDETERLEAQQAYTMPPPSNVLRPFEIEIVKEETTEEETTNVRRNNRRKRSNVHTRDSAGPSYTCASPSGDDIGHMHMANVAHGSYYDAGPSTAYTPQLQLSTPTPNMHSEASPFMHDFFQGYAQSPLFSPPMTYGQLHTSSDPMQSPYYSKFGVHSITPPYAHIAIEGVANQVTGFFKFIEIGLPHDVNVYDQT